MNESWPERAGKRPKTTPTNPHEQLEQNAPAELQEELWKRMATLANTDARSSQIAPAGSRALWLRTDGIGPAAFMIGREFAHLHPKNDGSLHLTLDPGTRAQALETGWAEPHPLAGQFAPAGTVMVYGPRDDQELDVVWMIVQQSYRFASGQIPMPDEIRPATNGAE